MNIIIFRSAHHKICMDFTVNHTDYKSVGANLTNICTELESVGANHAAIRTDYESVGANRAAIRTDYESDGANHANIRTDYESVDAIHAAIRSIRRPKNSKSDVFLHFLGWKDSVFGSASFKRNKSLIFKMAKGILTERVTIERK